MKIIELVLASACCCAFAADAFTPLPAPAHFNYEQARAWDLKDCQAHMLGDGRVMGEFNGN